MYKYWNGYMIQELQKLATNYSNLGDTLVRLVGDIRLDKSDSLVGAEYLVRSTEIEDLVQEVYDLGDRIQVVNGSFTGIVCGYEPHENRLVCVSDKIDRYKNDRTRYSYRLSEVQPFIVATKFTVGKWYKVNGRALLAVESVFNKNEIMLFSRDGKIAFRDVPMRCSKDKLRRLGIASIYDMEVEYV